MDVDNSAGSTVAKAASGPLDGAFVAAWSRRYLDAWNNHIPEQIAELCTPDIVWEDPSLATPAIGRAAVADVVRATLRAFPDLQVVETLPALIAPDRRTVLSRYELTGTMLGDWEASGFAATGATVMIRGIDQWTFQAGLLAHYTSYYDSLDVGRQLGIMPASGSRADRAMVAGQRAQTWLKRKLR